jgi:hypothetical protein
MPLRISELFYDAPPVAELPLSAVGLWVSAASWLSGWSHKTDHIPASMVRRVGATQEDAEALVDAGLWEPVEGGWVLGHPHLWGMGVPESVKLRKPIPPALRAEIYSRDGYACVVCGTGEDLQIDHIHPVSKGGTNAPTNLQTMCGYHNQKKGARIDGLVQG